MASAVRVAVRVRPVLSTDSTAGNGLRRTTSAGLAPTIVIEQSAQGGDDDDDNNNNNKTSTSSSNPKLVVRNQDAEVEKQYAFEQCLGPDVSQAQVYDALEISKLVEAALQGYHVTILAYGQTGSGKTYTINGPPQSAPRHPNQSELHQNAGIVLRALTDAFNQIREHRIASGEVVQVRNEVTAVEIYQENAIDLLSSRDTSLDVRFSKGNKFHVEGLTRRTVETPREAEICHLEAIHRRTTRAHKMNTHSSRSHFLFTLHTTTLVDKALATYGKLCFVDLAGSERLKDSDGDPRETGSINRSLFTLSQVIAGLSRQCTNTPRKRGGGKPRDKSMGAIIPYRNSKLTMLLSDALGGGGKTLVIACLSPLQYAFQESCNTLHFAAAAARIRSKPVKVLDQKSALIAELRQKVLTLEKRNEILESKLLMITNSELPAEELIDDHQYRPAHDYSRSEENNSRQGRQCSVSADSATEGGSHARAPRSLENEQEYAENIHCALPATQEESGNNNENENDNENKKGCVSDIVGLSADGFDFGRFLSNAVEGAKKISQVENFIASFRPTRVLSSIENNLKSSRNSRSRLDKGESLIRSLELNSPSQLYSSTGSLSSSSYMQQQKPTFTNKYSLVEGSRSCLLSSKTHTRRRSTNGPWPSFSTSASSYYATTLQGGANRERHWRDLYDYGSLSSWNNQRPRRPDPQFYRSKLGKGNRQVLRDQSWSLQDGLVRRQLAKSSSLPSQYTRSMSDVRTRPHRFPSSTTPLGKSRRMTKISSRANTAPSQQFGPSVDNRRKSFSSNAPRSSFTELYLSERETIRKSLSDAKSQVEQERYKVTKQILALAGRDTMIF